jgi:[ribosomal protein S18]-alanine N-acetyltransferase
LDARPEIAGKLFAIRDYRPADFDRLWEIDQRCFVPGIAYSRLALSSFIAKRNAITLVAEVADDSCGSGLRDTRRIVGYAVAHPARRKYGRILTLDILPEARRHGLATRIMADCEQRLRALGCPEVYLETAVDNEPALRLYRKLGYEILRTLPSYYASHALDAFLMGKRL